MKKTVLAAFTTLFFYFHLLAQSCLPDGISFITQAEIDSFPIKYPGCTVIEGGLSISGNSVNNLDSLYQITEVGALYISNCPFLPSLRGLENLKTIHQDLLLYKLDNSYNELFGYVGQYGPVNLEGLNGLLTVGGDLRIEFNYSLNSLVGLNSLTSVGGDFNFYLNRVPDMNGLNNLNAVGGVVTMEQNGFQNLHGLESLRSLPGYLIIRVNPRLKNLSGLDSLTSIGHSFQIMDCDSLISLEGLGSLVAAQNFSIIGNASLPNLNGLNPGFVASQTVGIQENAALKSIKGLESIKKLQFLIINDNNMLTSLSGVDSLESTVESLQIYKNNSLVSLNSLNQLTKIGTIFLLEGNHALTDLNGLNKLDTIGGFVSIQGNTQLKSLEGFDRLRHVEGYIYILGNATLTDLRGLDSLETAGYGLWIGNQALTSLNGLNNLRSVKEKLIFDGNASLKNFKGLDKLKSVGDLQIASNPSLKNCMGLEALDSVSGAVYIFQNPVITSLRGLQNIKTIGGATVQIQQNPMLSDCAIESFCNMAVFNPGSINFNFSNNTFPCDNFIRECAGIPIFTTVLADSNGDCLQDANPAPLAGVLVRMNGNSQTILRETQDDGVVRIGYTDFGGFTLSLPQFPTKNWAVCTDSLLFGAPQPHDTIQANFYLQPLNQCPELTINLGLPSFFRGCGAQSLVQAELQNTGTVLAEGVKTAVVVPPVFELISTAPPVAAQSGDTLFFELGDLKPFEISQVRLTVKTRCDTFLLGQTLCWEAFASLENNCPPSQLANSEIKLFAQCVGDSLVRFRLKNIGSEPTQSLHEYRIFRNAEAIQTGNFSLNPAETLNIDLPADGATYRMEATALEDGSLSAIALENCRGLTPGLITAFWLNGVHLQSDFDCRQVIGSFDPNLKSSIPTGVGPNHIITANQTLQYTIDFQNTGTDTAFRVLLRDVLPANLDLNTFRPGASSHPCTWQIRDRQLEVLFSPIALPDSNVNEAASHGFFAFEIAQKTDLPDGSIFENVADIVFDYNPPIVTNTVTHRIGHFTVQVNDVPGTTASWQVLGNPTRDVATFRAESFVAGEKRFELFDASGRTLRSVRFSGQEYEFYRDMLPEGLYFFCISDAQHRVFSGKVVVME